MIVKILVIFHEFLRAVRDVRGRSAAMLAPLSDCFSMKCSEALTYLRCPFYSSHKQFDLLQFIRCDFILFFKRKEKSQNVQELYSKVMRRISFNYSLLISL